MALAGLIVRDGSGVPRVGMLGAGPSVAAVAAAWKVQVGPFPYVHQIANAIQISGLSAAEQVDIAPATGIPAGQARIDVVCWDQIAAALTVVQGVPGTSPVVPSNGSLAVVARVRVNSGDGMVVAEQVTPAFTITALAGQAGIWLKAAATGSPSDRAALRNGWTNNENANWAGLQTRFTPGVTNITGAVTKAGAYASLEVIAQLAPGMFPEVPTMLPAAYGTQGGYVLARPNGTIVTVQAGAGGQIAIGGVIVPGS